METPSERPKDWQGDHMQGAQPASSQEGGKSSPVLAANQDSLVYRNRQ
jgi:hypothetical protein